MYNKLLHFNVQRNVCVENSILHPGKTRKTLISLQISTKSVSRDLIEKEFLYKL